MRQGPFRMHLLKLPKCSSNPWSERRGHEDLETPEVSHTQSCHHTVSQPENSLLWGCSVHYRMLSSLPSLSSLYASSAPSPSCDNQKYLQVLPNVSWGAKLLPDKNHWSRVLCILFLSLPSAPSFLST